MRVATDSKFVSLYTILELSHPWKPIKVTFVCDESVSAVWVSRNDAVAMCGDPSSAFQNGSAMLPASVACFLPKEMRDALYYNVMDLHIVYRAFNECPENDAIKFATTLWEQFVPDIRSEVFDQAVKEHFKRLSDVLTGHIGQCDKFVAEEQQRYAKKLCTAVDTRMALLDIFILEQQQEYKRLVQDAAATKIRIDKLAERL